MLRNSDGKPAHVCECSLDEGIFGLKTLIAAQ